MAAFAFVGCNNAPDREKELSADQAQDSNTPTSSHFTQRWDDAWNQNNADSIQGLLASDVVFLVDGQELSDEERDQWLLENSAVMKDLKTTSEVDNTTTDMVYQAGTYTHGIKNDTMALDGSFTLIWERDQEQGQRDPWKVKLMHISQKADTLDSSQEKAL